MNSKGISELARDFVATVIAGRDAFQKGDVPAHNRCRRREDRIAQAIVDLGRDGKAAMEAFLTHTIPSVRLAAASNVLRWGPSKAAPVLEDLLLWAKQDRSGDLFGEALQVLNDVHGLLAQHYAISVLDVDSHVFAKRASKRGSRSD